MYKIKELRKINELSPTEYEGILDTGQQIYIRYRWGKLIVRISYKPSNNILDAINGHEIFSVVLDDLFDSIIDDNRLIKICSTIMEFPEIIKNG